MTDSRIVIDLAEPDLMDDLSAALLQHVGQGEKCSCGMEFDIPFLPDPSDYALMADHLRDVMLEALKEYSTEVREVEADALVEASEVVDKRMEKRVNGLLVRYDEGQSAPDLFNPRIVGALTAEAIIFRWLRARAEAVRSQ